NESRMGTGNVIDEEISKLKYIKGDVKGFAIVFQKKIQYASEIRLEVTSGSYLKEAAL
ncbi:hypothetical protein SK128_013829, partial [Halocaridina rubra]